MVQQNVPIIAILTPITFKKLILAKCRNSSWMAQADMTVCSVTRNSVFTTFYTTILTASTCRKGEIVPTAVCVVLLPVAM